MNGRITNNYVKMLEERGFEILDIAGLDAKEDYIGNDCNVMKPEASLIVAREPYTGLHLLYKVEFHDYTCGGNYQHRDYEFTLLMICANPKSCNPQNETAHGTLVFKYPPEIYPKVINNGLPVYNLEALAYTSITGEYPNGHVPENSLIYALTIFSLNKVKNTKELTETTKIMFDPVVEHAIVHVKITDKYTIDGNTMDREASDIEMILIDTNKIPTPFRMIAETEIVDYDPATKETVTRVTDVYNITENRMVFVDTYINSQFDVRTPTITIDGDEEVDTKEVYINEDWYAGLIFRGGIMATLYGVKIPLGFAFTIGYRTFEDFINKKFTVEFIEPKGGVLKIGDVEVPLTIDVPFAPVYAVFEKGMLEGNYDDPLTITAGLILSGNSPKNTAITLTDNDVLLFSVKECDENSGKTYINIYQFTPIDKCDELKDDCYDVYIIKDDKTGELELVFLNSSEEPDEIEDKIVFNEWCKDAILKKLASFEVE